MNGKQELGISGWVEPLAGACWSPLVRQQRAVAILLSTLYFVITGAAAYLRMFYTDEFYTLYVARLGTVSAISRLLATGGEFHPALFYKLEHTVVKAFSETELALRLPQVVGFWLMLVAVFVYLSRRTSVIASFTGAVFPILTSAYPFASEARGYALVLGFASLAVMCWDAAAQSRHRTVFLVGLWGALTSCVASNYYGFLIVVPLALAQAARCWRIRKPEVGTWLAIGGVVIPLVLSLHLLQLSVTRTAGMWSAPPWSALVTSYIDFFRPAAIPILCIVSIVGLRQMLCLSRKNPSVSREPECDEAGHTWLPCEQVVLVVSLLGFAILVQFVAVLVTHAYAMRYALPTVLGAAMLLGLWAGRAKRSDQVLLFVIFLAYAVAIPGVRTLRKVRVENRRVLAVGQWLAADKDSVPIAVDGLSLFLKLHHYGPTAIKARLRFLVDPDRERNYTGETMGATLLLLNESFRLPVAMYSQFLNSAEEFCLLSEHWEYWSETQWLTKALLDEHRSLVLVGERGVYMQFRVKSHY
jgi:hypothetical protein